MKFLVKAWIKAMQGILTEKDLFNRIAHSYPPLASVTFTRQCQLSCKHCIYPTANKADLACSDLSSIDQTLASLSRIYPNDPIDLVHVGRMLTPEHLPLLKKYQNLGMSLCLIDNGSATRLIPEIQRVGVFFNGGIDISVDGYAQTHENQRGRGTWPLVLEAINRLPEIAEHISLTGTASSVNYHTIAEDLVKIRQEFRRPRIVQLTTTSPGQYHRQRIALTPAEMRHIFTQMLNNASKCDQHLLLYRLDDLAAIINLLPKKFTAKYISIEWKINKLRIAFFPPSIVMAEEFAIDSNGRQFLPFTLDWHLGERPENYENRNNLILTDPKKSYRRLIRKYQDSLGHQFFCQERIIFQKYFL